ncbi:MAG: hypothetical protein WAO61_04290 [Solirubrobacterales bacterium]
MILTKRLPNPWKQELRLHKADDEFAIEPTSMPAPSVRPFEPDA